MFAFYNRKSEQKAKEVVLTLGKSTQGRRRRKAMMIYHPLRKSV